MISPTFQRITYSPIQDKIFSTAFSLPAIIHPSSHLQNDLIPSVCSAQSYDDICTNPSDKNLRLLSYPNVTLLTSLTTNRIASPSSSSAYSTSTVSRYTLLYSTSTSSYQILNASTLSSSDYTSNSTYYDGNPPLIVSVRSPTSNKSRSIFHWRRIWVILVPVLCGILLCIILALFAFIKYRRKDVGVYEVEEAQRFRPLIVELTPSPGEHNQEKTNSTTTSLTRHTSKKDYDTDSHKKRKRKKSPINTTDEQREFYI